MQMIQSSLSALYSSLVALLALRCYCKCSVYITKGQKKKPELGQTWTNLEGDDQVHLIAHNREQFGSQMARQADLWMLCVLGERRK